jgi:hypothetical protein
MKADNRSLQLTWSAKYIVAQTRLCRTAILNAVAVRLVAGAVPSGQTVQQSLLNFDGAASVALRS